MKFEKNKSNNKKNSKAPLKTMFNIGGSKKKDGLANNVFFYILTFVLIYSGVMLLISTGEFAQKDTKTISELVTLIKEEKIQDITVEGDDISVLMADGSSFVTQKETGLSFDDLLTNNQVDRSKIKGNIEIKHSVDIAALISNFLIIISILILAYIIFRQVKGAGNDIFSFGRSRAKLFSKETSQITFKDVAGNAEAKTEMMEIVDFLKNSQKYRKLGARVPKGVLLIGPAGVGKTLLAKAIAGEANVPFFSVAGSEFMEMLVGVGSSRVRDLFKMARLSQPSLIFIDEIDAIGRQRGIGIGGGHDEREQTLNQILIEMDGFDTRTDVIVLAATNRPDMLDSALVRAGRFDRRIAIPLPDLKDREEIVKIHMRGKPIAADIDVEKIARKTVGFSGADIENMLNESAILAARNDQTEITAANIEEASLKVTMGAERKTIQTEHERNVVAYHEAGHAVVASNMPDMDPVNRVSIIARGGSLGHTSFPPERDRHNESKDRLISLITTYMGGRAAEKIVFNEITVGAAGDIEGATSIARKMVMEYGMSDIGPISFEGKNGNWMSQQMGNGNAYSEETAARIDREVNMIITTALKKAEDILIKNRTVMDKVVARLLEKETIDGDEYKEIIGAV